VLLENCVLGGFDGSGAAMCNKQHVSLEECNPSTDTTSLKRDTANSSNLHSPNLLFSIVIRKLSLVDRNKSADAELS
jgi:hypothetical protein